MSEEILENGTPNNPEVAEPNTENETPETNEELTKAQELANNQKIRAEKAEAELKRLKAESENQTPKNDENKTQKNEPSQDSETKERIDKLTLKSEGITHPDDVKSVLDEAKRLQLPVEEVAGMDYMQSKLKSAKTQREAESGMPNSSGKSSGSTKNTVEYWLDRKDSDGNYQTPDDLDLANQVIEARMTQQTKKSQFADDLY